METKKRLNSRKRPLSVFMLSFVGAIPAAVGQPEAAGAASNNACSDAAIEARLQQRETALLGAKHANEHANARAKQCRVARGLEKVQTADPKILAAAARQPTDVMGQWSSPINIPVAGVTSVLLNNGQVLFWSYDPTQWANPNASNTGVAYLWNPTTKTGRNIPAPENIWCGGQTILSDGRVYLAGGNLRYPDPTAAPGQTGWEGSLTHYTFNPNTASFTRQVPDMMVGRWYPTTTKLADNRVVITSGYDQYGGEYITHEVEVFTPSSTMDGNGSITAISPHDPSGLYPFQYVLASGKMLQVGPNQTNTSLLTVNTWNWSNIPEMKYSHYLNANGLIYTDASVTPVKQVVLIAGGTSGNFVINNIEMLDGINPGAGWKSFPSWLQARHNSNTVILADGTLFTVGGNNAMTTYDNPLFESEIYPKAPTDTTGSWTQVMPHTLQAAYHSSAILLPDATVLLSQDDQDKSAALAHQVQVYSPPYLFKGSRPQITSLPAAATWGQSFAVGTDTAKIASAILIAPGATTHGNDMHQRAIKLAFRANGRNLQVTIPSSPALVPPGYYMLFILNSSGVPSVARFIRIT